MDKDLNRRLREVAKRRGGHFHVRDAELLVDPRSAADDLARSFRFYAIGESWKMVSPVLAARTLARFLHQWLAYPIEFMPAAEAQSLAEQFVASFGPEPVCLTNIDWSSSEPGPVPSVSVSSYSWMPITESTFDAGLVCFGSSQFGMLWFQEED